MELSLALCCDYGSAPITYGPGATTKFTDRRVEQKSRVNECFSFGTIVARVNLHSLLVRGVGRANHQGVGLLGIDNFHDRHAAVGSSQAEQLLSAGVVHAGTWW
jgi:hypothetical protein